MIKIICIGKIKEDYLKDLIDDYKRRISRYHNIEIIELKEEVTLKKEKESILSHINNRDYVIACCIEGVNVTSEDFADIIDKNLMSYGNITFIIGSSEGLDLEVKNIANRCISFSRCTFPHGLFRGILLEQIYRAFKIINNETYHK